MMTFNTFVFAAVAFGLGAVSQARADLLDFRMFNTANYTQTTSGSVFQGYSFEMDDITQSSVNFKSARVNYPGAASPAMLKQSASDPEFFNNYFGPYASLAALHSQLPFGNYTTSFTNGTVTDSATIDYSADEFQSSVPVLTASSLAAVETWNPSGALTLHFNGFIPRPEANDDVATYVTIFGAASTPFSTSLAPSATSVTIPGGTLKSDTAYTLEISQGGRIGTAANSMGVQTELGFAVNDSVDFVTVPEPADIGMCFVGLATVWFFYRRKSGLAGFGKGTK